MVYEWEKIAELYEQGMKIDEIAGKLNLDADWIEKYLTIYDLTNSGNSVREQCRRMGISNKTHRKIVDSLGIRPKKVKNPKKKPRKEQESTYFMLDFETNSFQGVHGNKIEPRFGVIVRFDLHGAIYERNYFEGRLGFLAFVDPYLADTNVIIYTHNLKFDENLFFRELIKKKNWICKPIINGGLTIKSDYVVFENKTAEEITEEKTKKLNAKRRKYPEKIIPEDSITVRSYREYKQIEFRDSYRLLMASVKQLGQFVGLPKIEQDYNVGTIDEQYIEYCYRDCEIVIRAIQKLFVFCKDLGLTMRKMPLTTASLALSFFRLHNSTVIEEGKPAICPFLPPDNWITKKWEEESYFGGRTEVFNFQLHREAYGYDINSMYPSNMIDTPFPLPPYDFESYNEFTDLDDPNIFGYEAIVWEDSHFPLLPERTKTGVIFKNGAKRVNIFKFEYDYLMKNAKNAKNHIEILGIYKCSGFDTPFQYLREFYDRKAKKDEMSLFYKILLNSSYGVFGKKLEREQIHLFPSDFIPPPEFDEGIEECYANANNNRTYLSMDIIDHRTKKEIFFDRNIIIACQITAKSRLRLTESLNIVADEFGVNSVIYCDTDSIFVNQNADRVLNVSNRLGDWKLEEFCKNLQVYAPKEYVFEQEDGSFFVKAKGLSKTPEQGKLTRDDLIAYHTQGFEAWSLTAKKTMLNYELDTIHEKITLKKSKNTYAKRIINADLTTIPYSEESWGVIENSEEYQRIVAALGNGGIENE